MTSGARPSPSPEAVRALAATDRLEEAGALLAELVRAEPRLGRERLPLALLAVEVGRADLALAQLEAAAAEASDDPAIAAELTSLRAELALAERVPSPPTRPSSSDQEPPPQAVEDPFGGTFSDDATDPLDLDPYLEPSDADLVRFLHAFAGREGVHARQWVEAAGTPRVRAGYAPVHEPLTPSLVRAHLSGGMTLGLMRASL